MMVDRNGQLWFMTVVDWLLHFQLTISTVIDLPGRLMPEAHGMPSANEPDDDASALATPTCEQSGQCVIMCDHHGWGLVMTTLPNVKLQGFCHQQQIMPMMMAHKCW